MTKSDTIDLLATALSKAQGEIENATKDGKNPHFNAKYATLAAILSEIRPVFSKHGLSLIQTPSSDEKGYLLTTTLMHSSGQFISSQMALELVKQDMQGLGSALTYARRYMAAAFAMIHQEDDDATAAVAKPKESLQRLVHAVNESGIPNKEMTQILSDAYGVKSASELKSDQINEVCEILRKGDSKDLYSFAKEKKAARGSGKAMQ